MQGGMGPLLLIALLLTGIPEDTSVSGSQNGKTARFYGISKTKNASAFFAGYFPLITSSLLRRIPQPQLEATRSYDGPKYGS
jgi:hypothetical protein